MPSASEPRTANAGAGTGQPAIDDLAFSLVAALHRHPHLSNVLTHISRSSWPRIEQTLRVILDARTQRNDLTPLARNMLDLMCAGRGDTGRIFKPYFNYLLGALAGPQVASTLSAHIAQLAGFDDDQTLHEIPAPGVADAAASAGVAIHA